MASAESIKILKVYQVAPPESATELSLPITFFDAICFRFPPAERIYFYKLTESSPSFFHSEILPKLQCSLSLTLPHFLLLAGNLTWPSHSPRPIILYSQNDTLSLTVAESTADFDRLASNGIREAAELRPYIPELLVSDRTASIMALQITVFPHKGFSIGISMNHTVVDGKSASMFLKAWAHICKNTNDDRKPITLLPELTPSFDRTAIIDPDELEPFYLNQWRVIPGLDQESNPRSLKWVQHVRAAPDSLRATFELNRERIDKLREIIENYHKERGKDLHLSSVVITLAYVSDLLVKARGSGAEIETKVCFLLPVDCRSRLNPPVPQNYFGSCLHILDTYAEAAAFTEENGVAIVAEKLSDSINGMKKGVTIFQGVKERHKRVGSAGAEVIKVKISGSPRLEYYKEDFGWGKPEKVDIVSIDRFKGICLLESKDESGGIEVGLVLPRHEMEVFSSLFLHASQNVG